MPHDTDRIDPIKVIARFLDTAGDGSGTKNANGDYSITPDEFYFQPKRDCRLDEMTIYIQDTKGMEPEEYGNLGSALSNGYSILIKDADGNGIVDFCDGDPIKINADFSKLAYKQEVSGWVNTTNEAAHIGLDFVNFGTQYHVQR